MTMYYGGPQPFSGGSNGRYRNSVAPASGGAVDPASSTYVGAAACTAQAARGPALEDAGIRAGEIIAYRAWILQSDGLLHGVFIDSYIWQPGCVEHAPLVHPFWGEGLHAFKNVKEAKRQYGFFSGALGPVVFGEVALWGEVIEHERGYRAEYAAIRALVDIEESYCGTRSWKFWKPSTLTLVRRRYGLTSPPVSRPSLSTPED